MLKTMLLAIDPQNDFTNPLEKVFGDPNASLRSISTYIERKASLYVNGAKEDMQRLASFITKNRQKIFDIHVTLDSHHLFQIFHPLFWKGSDGKQPAPFTCITQDSIEKGIWTPVVPSMRDRALEYVKALAINDRYKLIIWPPHCLIGTWGTAVNPVLAEALLEWEQETIGMVNYVTKGSNPYTEHYSAVKAEVPDPTDASTQLNQQLVDILTEADVILVAGEALDYCLYNSLKDIASSFGVDNTRKIKILEDCTSAIDPNAVSKIKQEFGAMGIEFVNTSYFDA